MGLTGAALSLDGVTKSIGRTVVLRDITAAIPASSISAIVGPNGAGKTTLFHVITGHLSADRGEVLMNGQSIRGWPPWKIARNGLGKLFQDVKTFDSLTVLENVELALLTPGDRSLTASLRRTAAQRRHQAISILNEACLEQPYDRKAGTLSFGNKKLLALARLIAGGFRTILLDEPTAGLSPAAIETIGRFLLSMRSRGRTIVFIEHNISFVQAFADEVYVLSDGRIHDRGPTAVTLDRISNREVLLGL